MTNETMTRYNGATGLPEALGGQVFSVPIDSLNLVSGHWNATSADNATATFGKIQFTATGPNGATGWATVIVPKVLVPKVLVGLYPYAVLQGRGAPRGLLAHAAPTVYVDGQPVTATYFTSDSTNFYITFQVHFSTHQIEIQFTALAISNSTATSTSAEDSTISVSPQTSSSTLGSTSPSTQANSSTASGSSSLHPSYALLVTGEVALILVAGTFAVKKRLPR